jgi:hypothetical protein
MMKKNTILGMVPRLQGERRAAWKGVSDMVRQRVSMLEVYVAAENYSKARDEVIGIRSIIKRRRPFLERIERRLVKYEALTQEILNDENT